MKRNQELMDEAKASLTGRWGIAIGGYLIYNLIVGITQNIPIVGGLAALILTGPMALGLAYFSLKIARNEEPTIELIFSGFKDFGKALGTYLLMVLYIILWMLLLIIPGIIKALAYSQTFYILAEDKSLGSQEAILKSKEMMDGYKWKYFLLGFNFIGWALLCILTLGIGFLWLIPYIQVTNTKFYLNLKENYNAKNSLTEEAVSLEE